jgi:acyl carrier protein
MEKDRFLNELKDLLEIDGSSFTFDTPLSLTSIETLGVIIFVDENFNKQISAKDLKMVKSPKDLMMLIGKELFPDDANR